MQRGRHLCEHDQLLRVLGLQHRLGRPGLRSELLRVPLGFHFGCARRCYALLRRPGDLRVELGLWEQLVREWLLHLCDAVSGLGVLRGRQLSRQSDLPGGLLRGAVRSQRGFM